PKRSASSMTMTEALGTSMPTSMTVVETSTSLVGLEARHDRLFFVRAHLPVQQADAKLREDGVGDMLAQLGRALRLEFFALFDQRADDVDLAALAEQALRGGIDLRA